MSDGAVIGASVADVDTEWLTVPMAEPWVRLTHRPTGTTAEGPSHGEAMGELIAKLTASGDITINTARAAAGLPPAAEPDPLVLPPDEMGALRRAIEAAYGPDWRDKIAVPRPAGDPLTKDEVRQLLRECVTVVKPGEVLVIRMGTDVPREQALEYQVTLGDFLASHAPGVKVAIVCGDELGVAKAVTDG